jgi:hypothetical protein
LTSQELPKGDRFVVAFEPSRSGLVVPGSQSGSSFRIAEQQPLADYLYLEESSSGRKVRILRGHMLDYKRLEPFDPVGNYDGILHVAQQCILEEPRR